MNDNQYIHLGCKQCTQGTGPADRDYVTQLALEWIDEYIKGGVFKKPINEYKMAEIIASFVEYAQCQERGINTDHIQVIGR
jgi:hypothetical protein